MSLPGVFRAAYVESNDLYEGKLKDAHARMLAAPSLAALRPPALRFAELARARLEAQQHLRPPPGLAGPFNALLEAEAQVATRTEALTLVEALPDLPEATKAWEEAIAAYAAAMEAFSFLLGAAQSLSD